MYMFVDALRTVTLGVGLKSVSRQSYNVLWAYVQSYGNMKIQIMSHLLCDSIRVATKMMMKTCNDLVTPHKKLWQSKIPKNIFYK